MSRAPAKRELAIEILRVFDAPVDGHAVARALGIEYDAACGHLRQLLNEGRVQRKLGKMEDGSRQPSLWRVRP